LRKTDESGHFLFPAGGITAKEAVDGSADQYELIAMNQDRFLGAWKDTRNFECYKIYYQIFDMNGHPLLHPNGEPIYEHAEHDQQYPKAAATPDGGAIITWCDKRDGINYRIYSQKIDSDGNILWDANGVRVSLLDESQSGQGVCSDGAGGAYIAWDDYDGDLWIQHLNADGRRLFNDTGYILTSSGPAERVVNLVSDGLGGAILVYDYQFDPQIYAERILDTGSVLWSVPVYDLMTDDPGSVIAIPARGGGVIVAWEDKRNSYVPDIYAQKIDITGLVRWQGNGTPVIDLDDSQRYPVMAEDAEGYVYFAWRDARGTGYNVYCQRLSPEGVMQFPWSGLLVCDEPEDESDIRMVGDGQGGAIIAWSDRRMTNELNYGDIYGTHLDAQGQIANPFWVPNGSPICTGFGSQFLNNMISDGRGGAVLGWQYDFTVQRVNDFIEPDESYFTRSTARETSKIHISPNPFNPVTTISYHLPDAAFVRCSIYDITGRLVVDLVNGWRAGGSHEMTFDASNLASGIYLYTLEAGHLLHTGKMVLIK
jgi:hypothetical protein